MTAFVAVDGKPTLCRAKDPTRCPYHRNADGSPMLHYASQEAVYNEVERQEACRQRKSRYLDLCQQQARIERQTGMKDPALMREQERALRAIKVDEEWYEVVGRLHTFAGFKNSLEDPNENTPRSRRVALHEAAHAIVGLETGRGIKSISVRFDAATVSNGMVSYEDKFDKRDFDPVRILAAGAAGRQVDEAFYSNPSGWNGDKKSNDRVLNYYMRRHPNEDSAARRREIIEESRVEARAIIAKRIDEVIALADRIRRVGMMDGISVRSLLSDRENKTASIDSFESRPRRITVKPPLPPRPTVERPAGYMPFSEEDDDLVFDSRGRLRPASMLG